MKEQEKKSVRIDKETWKWLAHESTETGKDIYVLIGEAVQLLWLMPKLEASATVSPTTIEGSFSKQTRLRPAESLSDLDTDFLVSGNLWVAQAKYQCSPGHETDHKKLEDILSKGGDYRAIGIRSNLDAFIGDMRNDQPKTHEPKEDEPKAVESKAEVPKEEEPKATGRPTKRVG